MLLQRRFWDLQSYLESTEDRFLSIHTFQTLWALQVRRIEYRGQERRAYRLRCPLDNSELSSRLDAMIDREVGLIRPHPPSSECSLFILFMSTISLYLLDMIHRPASTGPLDHEHLYDFVQLSVLTYYVLRIALELLF